VDHRRSLGGLVLHGLQLLTEKLLGTTDRPGRVKLWPSNPGTRSTTWPVSWRGTAALDLLTMVLGSVAAQLETLAGQRHRRSAVPKWKAFF
jgi:hypothetical protein